MSAHHPERLLDEALNALSSSSDWASVLDSLPAPIYTTDTDGAVTYWNRACIELAGRVPELGKDRWCVTWQIYTMTGEFMPHAECPMAQAIKTRQAVRGSVAIALRPDGSRVAFRPYPTPLSELGQRAKAVSSFAARNYGFTPLPELIKAVPNFEVKSGDDGRLLVKRLR